MTNINLGTVARQKSRRKENIVKVEIPKKQRQNNVNFGASPLGKYFIAFFKMIFSILLNLFERASTIFGLLKETKRYVSVLSIINFIFIILIYNLNYKLSYPLYVGIYLGLTALNISLPRVYKGKLARFSMLDVVVLVVNLVLTYLIANTGVRSIFSEKYVYPAISFLVINISVIYFEKKKFMNIIKRNKKQTK